MLLIQAEWQRLDGCPIVVAVSVTILIAGVAELPTMWKSN
jgi:hypothetical protein